MHLVCTTLQPCSAINLAIYGNFSGPKQQEMVISRGNHLELLRPDEDGKLLTICSTQAFSIIRSIVPFRLAGSNRDYVVIGSDSGKVSVIEFDTATNNWKVLHCEVFGRTGCRRIVPGQYLAADPKGRAIMVGAVEKQKLVYVMNRDTSNKLTISSPLEAHKAETIVFSIVGVDVGFENPVFALIELEYTESDQDPTGEAFQESEKKLSYYELDLGLNHVVRKWSEPISRTANFLLAVPGGDNWPSGVLVCGENWISYKHEKHAEIRTPIPRRANLPVERGVLITSGALHKQKDLFFFILQSEYGDLYKVTLELDPNNGKIVTNLCVAVFDTIQPANALCITKTGFLYTASEFGNHYYYQFQGIDDSDALKSYKIDDENLNEELGDDSISASRVAPTFVPSPKLNHLLIADVINSLAPLTDMLVDDLLGDDSMQIYALCGRGNRSSLRTLRHGLSVTEVASMNIHKRATGIWSIKRDASPTDEASNYHRYVVVSYSDSTLVLSVGETIDEATDSGFLTTVPTLQVALLADNAMIQVYAQGIRYIRTGMAPSEWKPPQRRSIQLASVNARQVAISLSGGEVIYFELDEAGQLVETATAEMGKEISCLDVGVISEGRSRSMYLALGFWDQSYQILSLDPSDMLGRGPIMSTESKPTSIAFVEMIREMTYDDSRGSSYSSAQTGLRSLYLNIGLENGTVTRVTVDPTTGDLSDPRTKFLGPKAVKLARVSATGGSHSSAIMALSSRSWLLHNLDNKYHTDPLTYDGLDGVADISSEVIPHGFVGITGQTIRIFTLDSFSLGVGSRGNGSVFNQISVPLLYTPRKFIRLPQTKDLIVIESDINEYNSAEAAEIEARVTASNPASLSAAAANAGVEEDDSDQRIPVRGPVPPAEGKWASAIQVIEVVSGTVKTSFELSENEAALSICTCRFSQYSEETFIVVGTVKDLRVTHRAFTSASIHVYRLLPDSSLQLLHKTEVEEIPHAMIEFQGKLLVGVGRCLRLYDMGKKKLLKKTENKSFPSFIVKLQAMGDRVYVGDLSQSIIFAKYRRHENTFAIFADDSLPRFVTSVCLLDYNTIVVGDKFGSVYVLRLPESVNDDHSQVITGGNLWDQGLLNGAPHKAETIASFYLSDTPTQILKTPMKAGGLDVILVSTISGAIYALLKCKTKDEVLFFSHLEMFLRQEMTTLTHRDHMSYRSYYHPVKNVVDGDLCLTFLQNNVAALSNEKKREFSENIVERSMADIIKKLEELHSFV